MPWGVSPARLAVHRLDVVAVRIEQKGRVVGGPIIPPRSWRAVVAAADRKTGPVKGIDRGAIASPERDVDRTRRLRRLRQQPKSRRSFGTESRGRLIRTCEDMSQRLEHSPIKL